MVRRWCAGGAEDRTGSLRARAWSPTRGGDASRRPSGGLRGLRRRRFGRARRTAVISSPSRSGSMATPSQASRCAMRARKRCRMLAHPTCEHESVEPFEGGDASAEERHEPVQVDVEREARIVVVPLAGARACRPTPDRPSSPLRWVSTSARSSTRSASHSTAPGSSEPERVAMTRPSSGREPHRGDDAAAVEGGAERVAATEVGDDDPPCLRRRARPPGPTDQAWERPWNP